MAVEDAEQFMDDAKRQGVPRSDLNMGSDVEIAHKIVDGSRELFGPMIVAEARLALRPHRIGSRSTRATCCVSSTGRWC